MNAKIVCLFVLVTSTLLAADPPVSSKEEKIRELLRVTGSSKIAVQVMDQILDSFRKTMPDVPAAFWDELRSQVRPEDLEAMIVPIYAKHYDDGDIQAMLDFYDSPVGRKMLSETPGVVSESMEAGKKWGADLARRVLEKLRQSGYKTTASAAPAETREGPGTSAGVR